MMRTLTHRGPDSDGIWKDPDAAVVLGHNRLAILDRSSAGAQPMTSAMGRYVVTFNGEIYNFSAVRRAVDRDRSDPPIWRGHSDTEVLVEAFEVWGVERALARIEGMFAIAVWDRLERKLWLIRDRMGEKPLYYGQIGSHLAFASELKALRAAFGTKLQINDEILCEYLRLGYVPAPDTIYRDLRKLPAGNLICINGEMDGSFPPLPSPRPYWTLKEILATNRSSGNLSESVAAEEMDVVLRQAVAERIVSDVPVGAFLSGGIDSSLIVALMAQLSSSPVRTFTIAFDDARYDESRYARAVAATFDNVEHTELVVTAPDALDLIPRLGEVFSEPFADPSQIPTCLLAQLARQDITVALSGEGADELFGGYDKYLAAQRLWPLMSGVPVSIRRQLSRILTIPSVHSWDVLLRFLPQNRSDAQRLNGDRLHKLAAMISADDRRGFYTLLSGNWRPADDAVLLPQRATRDCLIDMPPLDFVHEMMATDLLTSLADGILTKVDRATMAVSLESRAPFLAESVVKFAWRLPIDLKVSRSQGKLVLRNVLGKYFPPELANRGKMGFSAPLDNWLRGRLRPWAEHLLEAPRLEANGFRSAPVRKTWQEHVSGDRNWQFALWPVLMWQSFFDARV